MIECETMILLTLEGLDKSCEEILKCTQATLKSHILPWPNSPVATSAQPVSIEITTCLSGMLARMRCLQRAQSAVQETGGVVCGAHWLDTPKIIDPPARKVLHDLVLELSEKLANIYRICVSNHIMVFVRTSEHEMFERLCDSMESRDVLLSDLYDVQQFLDDARTGKVRATVFPTRVELLKYPSYANDNQIDIAIATSKVVGLIRDEEKK